MLTVVIPTYQERDNIEPLLKRLKAVKDSWSEPLDVVMVDGHSDDGTVAVASAMLAALSLGRLIQPPRRDDLAHAVLYGIHHATGDLIGVMDADLSHPPELLPALVSAIRKQDRDMAIASRYVAAGGVNQWPWRRRLLSQLGNVMAWPLVRVADATSGYFVCRKDLLAGLTLESRGFKILLEILVKGCVHDVAEVPYQFTDRVHGRSKLGIRVLARYLHQLMRLYVYRWRSPCRHLVTRASSGVPWSVESVGESRHG